MARGTSLGELVNQLRLAAGRDPNPALSISTLDQMKQFLRQEQERLYDEFDWPFLQVTRDKTLEAGSYFYDVPEDMNLERIQKVDILSNGHWLPVDRGISLDQYNVQDSDEGLRSDPVSRWDVKDTGDGAQIEVWPIPATDGSTLRFTGIRKLRPLIANDDTADLDDQMVVNFVAADILAAEGNEAATTKLAKAKSRMVTLQGRVTKSRTNTLSFAGRPSEDCGRRAPRVAWRS
jgi:hypothetical protein